MHSAPRKPLPPASLVAGAAGHPDALIRQALALRQAASAGRIELRLRDKNIGLVAEDPLSADAALFERAASELGARVALIRPSVAGLDGAQDATATAAWLGRLYHAVECQGLPASRVEQIRQAAGIPVFDALGGRREGVAELLAALGAGVDEADGRRYYVQAALLNALA